MAAVRRHPWWTLFAILALVSAINNINQARVELFPSTTTWWNQDGVDYIVFGPGDDVWIDLPAHTAVRAKTSTGGFAVEVAYTCQTLGFADPSANEDQAIVISGGAVKPPVPARTVAAPVTASPRPVDPFCRTPGSMEPRTPSPAPSGG
jgi:hypothetical protein